MPASLICMSHGGLMNVDSLLSADDLAVVNAEIEATRATATALAPDLVIKFGNDHNSGFSLRLMPPFMIGLRGRTLGDFGTSKSPITIDEARGRALVRWLHDAGVDVATSYDALFDHGIAMALDKLFGGVDRVPAIPVFTNCGGDLRPPLPRSLALGTAIGAFFRTVLPELRVMFVGSGGLSHDPPLPDFETSPPAVQQRMIDGVDWTAQLLADRLVKVTDVGREHGAGEGDLQPLNPAWDQAMLQHFAAGNLEAIAAQDDTSVLRAGGRGAAEIRNWLAAFAALKSYSEGHYQVQHQFYRPLPSWIVGFASVMAIPVQLEMAA